MGASGLGNASGFGMPASGGLGALGACGLGALGSSGLGALGSSGSGALGTPGFGSVGLGSLGSSTQVTPQRTFQQLAASAAAASAEAKEAANKVCDVFNIDDARNLRKRLIEALDKRPKDQLESDVQELIRIMKTAHNPPGFLTVQIKYQRR